MIEVKAISKSFKDKNVLDNVSATFEKGKANLIIGASGTGKSVLLNTIIGLIKPDVGDIFYDSRKFNGADEDTIKNIRREMGVLFQGSALFDSKNVEQNVMFPLDALTTMPKSEKQDRVNFCLQRVGLDNVNKLFPSEISGGMQKRVGIARAIVMNTKYLFCDEPNSGLDPQTSIRIDNLISEITEEYKTTTVIVTHDMNSVMEIGENVIFIYKGKKLWEGNNVSILHSDITELNSFIFANSLLRNFRDK